MTDTDKRVVTAFLGSARSNGSTRWILNKLEEGFNQYKDENMVFKKVDLYEYEIKPISRAFAESKQENIPDDGMKELIPMILTSKVIILATPIYWFSVSGIMKNFIDRWYDFSDSKGKLNLDGKALAIATAHANPSNSMSYPVHKMAEESAKFCNMVFLGGTDTISIAQAGTNEHEIASQSSMLLGKRVVDFLKI